MDSNKSQKLSEKLNRFGISNEHLFAIRFAINVAIATVIVWYTLLKIADTNPIWAIASMIASSDPLPMEAPDI